MGWHAQEYLGPSNPDPMHAVLQQFMARQNKEPRFQTWRRFAINDYCFKQTTSQYLRLLSVARSRSRTYIFFKIILQNKSVAWQHNYPLHIPSAKLKLVLPYKHSGSSGKARAWERRSLGSSPGSVTLAWFLAQLISLPAGEITQQITGVGSKN